jgi:hypothetical protein
MPFDWLRFFDEHRVEYKTSGANTSRDNVTIHCPFCGSADPSHHMSVNLSGRGFKCWRAPTHRGRNPARLVSALLNCSFERAIQLTGGTITIPNNFAQTVRDAMGTPAVTTKKPKPLTMPQEFKPFSGLPSSKPYVRYLREERGFTPRQIDRVFLRWGVRYCTMGAYRGRIIFPVRYQGELVSWTGRTIYPTQELRYKALSTDPERAAKEGYQPATGAISHFLLWYDDLMHADADTIILTEGPFDALKINVLGRKHGILATCCFTSAPTDKQVALLHRLLPRFRNRFTLFDAGTIATSMRVGSTLSSLGIEPARLPPQLKDPGDFTVSTFDKFMLTL